ncbi:MAG TPA: hypothetical protein VEN79_05350 [Terriglobia bacterium]|nr:hypothetical protein [Terriglobia bacterium]
MSPVDHLHQFGRTPRGRDPRVPHLSALIAGKTLTPPPTSVNNVAGMNQSFGMMLNDNLGDCTCAAFYHAVQVWTFHASPAEVTEPDQDVEDLYEQACGYNPAVSGPGPGGNEQHVLQFLLNTGAPVGPSGQSRNKILAYVEVDNRNADDVKRTISDCGVAYIGFPVPANVTYNNRTWDYDPQAKMTRDGHAVVLVGYDSQAATAISWGQLYTVTWAFVSKIVDEVYAIADPTWIAKTGKTPGGLTVAELETQMQALKEGSAAGRGAAA